MIRASVTLAALTLASAAGAQQIDCSYAVAQVELTACAEREWQAADAELNAVYAQALGRARETDISLGGTGAEDALRAAQRLWVPYRDAACAAEGYAFHGGSAEPMIIYGCRARLTWARIEDLNYLAEP
jgi:uncharacterized protein YecT (DUF1311 family)